MIEVAEAKRLLFEQADVLDVVEVGLEKARGRVLAEDVTADRDFPPTDRATMDGFAVRSDDVAEPGRELEISGEIRAGLAVEDARVDPGRAIRIMTGAIVPPGANAVVMLEMTEEDGDRGIVKIFGVPEPGQHIRAKAEDVPEGGIILRRGAPVHAPEIAALAAVGKTRVRVHRAPEVRVISTGDEVVDCAHRPEDHEVRNSNAWALMAQLEEMDLSGAHLGIAPDDRRDLARALREGLDGDVLLITGGVSAGKYDLVGDALTDAGVEKIFHKVSVRPGKPILVGRRDRCLVVGLPGNPVSTFTGFAVFVAPALRKMMGYARWDNLEITATLAERLKRRPGRTTYHLARVAPEEGRFIALPVRTMGSGDVVSMSRANAFVITPGGAHALEPGTTVPTIMWRDFHLR